MASIDTGKKGAPHIDMTPMVDLGFLLITFFMLATTMSKPKTMEIIKPAKDDKNNKDVPKVNVQRVQTVLLGENDKVYFYRQAAENDPNKSLTVDSADFSPTGVRAYIKNRQNEVAQAFGSKDTLVVLIKGMPKANYKNFVDIIDEMRITGVRQYAILDRDKIDTTIMENLGLIKK